MNGSPALASTPTVQTKRYITLDQVSEKLGGRSKASLYRDVAAGRLPKPIRFGRRCYFREVDVDAAMDRAESAICTSEI